MITVRNLKYYPDLPFDQYLQLPGMSFSTLRGFNGPETDNMRLGTRVHNYVLTPGGYDYQQHDTVAPIAKALKTRIGPILHLFQKELSFTCTFYFNGMKLDYRGRADLARIGSLIVDLKVSGNYLEQGCKIFGYPDAISGYCLATSTPMGLIISFNKKTKTDEYKIIRPRTDYWQEAVVKYGVPA